MALKKKIKFAQIIQALCKKIKKYKNAKMKIKTKKSYQQFWWFFFLKPRQV